METNVVIKTSFEALHCWKDCPYSEVDFLKNLHRHKFYVVIKWQVSGDRELEFFVQKNQVNRYLQSEFQGKDLDQMSCEEIAKLLLKDFMADFVSVFEDNENGAEVIR
jgi:6-pyruvoyl-tetrahydropterin synthase